MNGGSFIKTKPLRWIKQQGEEFAGNRRANWYNRHPLEQAAVGECMAFGLKTTSDVAPRRGRRVSGRLGGPGCRRENQRAYWNFTQLLGSMGELPLGAYPSGAYLGKRVVQVLA